MGGQGRIVVEALILTLSVFAILTLYTFQSKRDWSFLGAGLYSGLWLLIFWGLFSWFIGIYSGGICSGCRMVDQTNSLQGLVEHLHHNLSHSSVFGAGIPGNIAYKNCQIVL